ncbi:MAG: bile acid:sodium symporter family protein [Bacteroidia bacterium]|nr:bile acid:sodium symporter family protein [Bacteroidia bacterium]
MCESFDTVALNFSPDGLLILDITLFVIMYGVALELRVDDFRLLFKKPLAPFTGLASQLVLLPALTLALVWMIRPCPSMALGMFLVAACPGGNISNFMSLLAKGNVALSVSLSATTTILAIVMTPFNFAFWSQFYPPAAELLETISLNPVDIFTKILLILALPLLIGMWTAQKFPDFTSKITRPIRILSIVFFAGYIVAALALNFDFFVKYIRFVVLIVLAHNGLALVGGYSLSKIVGLGTKDARTISIETGIQNSGLALVLIFSPIFNGLGGMAMIAALWGIMHIVTGLSIGTIWSRIPPKS